MRIHLFINKTPIPQGLDLFNCLYYKYFIQVLKQKFNLLYIVIDFQYLQLESFQINVSLQKSLVCLIMYFNSLSQRSIVLILNWFPHLVNPILKLYITLRTENQSSIDFQGEGTNEVLISALTYSRLYLQIGIIYNGSIGSLMTQCVVERV